jgi:Resolvase, N terminal domain
MLKGLAPSDVVTVTRIDRLARSTFDLFAIVKQIVDAKPQFRSLVEPRCFRRPLRCYQRYCASWAATPAWSDGQRPSNVLPVGRMPNRTALCERIFPRVRIRSIR